MVVTQKTYCVQKTTPGPICISTSSCQIFASSFEPRPASVVCQLPILPAQPMEQERVSHSLTSPLLWGIMSGGRGTNMMHQHLCVLYQLSVLPLDRKGDLVVFQLQHIRLTFISTSSQDRKHFIRNFRRKFLCSINIGSLGWAADSFMYLDGSVGQMKRFQWNLHYFSFLTKFLSIVGRGGCRWDSIFTQIAAKYFGPVSPTRSSSIIDGAYTFFVIQSEFWPLSDMDCNTCAIFPGQDNVKSRFPLFQQLAQPNLLYQISYCTDSILICQDPGKRCNVK